MKILAIDYGRRWIGLAISDDERRLAFSYKTLVNDKKLFSDLNEIVKKEGVFKIVIGLPLNKQMKPTQQTVETENWARELIKNVATPKGSAAEGEPRQGREPRPDNSWREVLIDFENEIFTSKSAEKQGAKNQHAAAAAIFLQDYLDRKNR